VIRAIALVALAIVAFAIGATEFAAMSLGAPISYCVVNVFTELDTPSLTPVAPVDSTV
jgi:hypothetical protein